MMLAPKTRETKMRLLRALLRNKSTAAAAAVDLLRSKARSRRIFVSRVFGASIMMHR